MKNRLLKTLTIVLTAAFLIGFISLGSVSIVKADDLKTSGKCGSDATWEYADGVLTISGSGTTRDYAYTGVPIPWESFSDSINSLIINDGITGIGTGTFKSLKNLVSVKLPDSLKTMGWEAFSHTSSLKTIVIPDSVETIDMWAFSFSGIETIVLPEKLASLGFHCFDSCKALKIITIPDGIDTISSLFTNCDSLQSVILPARLKQINIHSFESCTGLTDIYFKGTEEEWKNVTIQDTFLSYLIEDGLVSIHYNYDGSHIHVITDLPAIPPTCTKTGKTEGSHCSICGEVFKAQETVKATGHKWNKGKVTKEPTVLKTGVKTYTCTFCGKTKSEKISKLTPTIKLSAAKKSIKVNKAFTLTISKLAKGDSIKSVKSGKTSIATVLKIGTNKYIIAGKKKGATVITVTLKSGKKATCTVTVK